MASVSGYYEYEIDAGGNARITKYSGIEEKVIVPAFLDGMPVKEIGEDAFNWKFSLKTAELPRGLVALGKNAFQYCANLESINLPDTVSSIKANPFSNCGKLKLSISQRHPFFHFIDSLLYSQDYDDLILCLAGNPDEVVVIHNGTKRIGDYAFLACEQLKSVTLPSSLISIGRNAFENCKNLVTPVFPAELKEISYGAFRGCESLSSLTLPEDLSSLGDRSFYGCTRLETVKLPDKLSTFSASAFSGCTNLASLEVSKSNSFFCLEEGVLFNKDRTGLVFYTPAKSGEVYSVPQGVESIMEAAFYGCNHLRSVFFPDSLKKIGSNSFSSCKNLTAASFPEGFESIGSWAFYRCEALASITLPDSITSIAYAAFCGCDGLKEVILPRQMLSLSQNVFGSCKNLKSISLPEGLLAIESTALFACSGLAAITFPNSLERIESKAFSECKGLTSITLPDGIKEVSSIAFSGCSKLTSVTLPPSIISVRKDSFPKSSKLIYTVHENSPMEEWVKKCGFKYIYSSSSGKPAFPDQEAKSTKEQPSRTNASKSNESHQISRREAILSQPEISNSYLKGINHTGDQAVRVPYKIQWSIEVPPGFIFSLDQDIIDSISRSFVIMQDDGDADFVMPYNANVSFVVSKHGYEWDTQGRGLTHPEEKAKIKDFKEILTYGNPKKSAFIIDSDDLVVYYRLATHTKDFSEIIIEIFTRSAFSKAQMVLDERWPMQDRAKEAEKWIKTIRPITHKDINKPATAVVVEDIPSGKHATKTEKPVKPKTPAFSSATPDVSQYWHYTNILKTQGGLSGISNVVHVVNEGGTEFVCCPIRDSVEPFAENSKALRDELKYDAAAENDYTCHELATEMRRLFRVSDAAFNMKHDRECEIEEKMLRRAYMLSALKSFAWTLGSWTEESGKESSEMTEVELTAFGEFIESRGWLNYTADSYYSGLCNHSDLHVIYLSDQSLAAYKDTIEPKLECASLNDLRDDLSKLEPVMRKIHALLARNRDRSKPLEGTLADVLQAWCVMTLAAEEPFWTEDGPMTCWFTQLTDGDVSTRLSSPLNVPQRKDILKATNRAQNTGVGNTKKTPPKVVQESKLSKKESETQPIPSNIDQVRLQRIASLKSEIVSLNSDLNDLTGWFKGRQRRELTERIEVKKSELKRLEQQ